MSDIATLHVCPNGCCAPMITVAHVAQDWKVDAFGNFLECIADGETVAGPDEGNIWTCDACGAECDHVATKALKTRLGTVRTQWPVRNGKARAWYFPDRPEEQGFSMAPLEIEGDGNAYRFFADGEDHVLQ